MSSSTSSSDEQRWRRSFLGFVVSTAILVPLLWLGIVLADPFDTLHLSPSLERLPVVRNQRYASPALARNPAFDSAVTGTSTVLLLDPEQLDRDLGGRFLNLSLKLGVPHEMYKLMRVFRRHHAEVRTIIVSLGYMWLLQPDGRSTPTTKHFAFPEWMYDTDPWNDYAEHFNWYTLRHVPRRLQQSLGGARPRYRADGYQRYTPDASLYDLAKVRRKLYGKPDPTPGEIEQRQQRPPDDVSEGGSFDLATLRDLLALFPAETEKILLLPPLHVTIQPSLAKARGELVEMAGEFENVRVLDFMFPSEITRTDTNYWDPSHYTVGIAARVSALIAASRDPAFESDVCRVLWR